LKAEGGRSAFRIRIQLTLGTDCISEAITMAQQREEPSIERQKEE
jgi:hypothetical protein